MALTQSCRPQPVSHSKLQLSSRTVLVSFWQKSGAGMALTQSYRPLPDLISNYAKSVDKVPLRLPCCLLVYWKVVCGTAAGLLEVPLAADVGSKLARERPWMIAALRSLPDWSGLALYKLGARTSERVRGNFYCSCSKFASSLFDFMDVSSYHMGETEPNPEHTFLLYK
ncbi:hypothetical protein QAD02_003727 [Eretmocerus hayati]|uniref:Uncharacterized protein n=1 Tax=Eretmocerus hayati TaxID=131215 RepID=A0ACC2NNR6_9HYME|nr:hypothetical protein QAD02_003727 [Eretmocerus hayati]